MKKLIVIFCVVFLAGCSYDNTPQPISSESQSSEIPLSSQEEISETSEEESKVESEEEIPQIENPDFRNTKWGMSIKEVKKIETANLGDEDSTNLFFTDTVLSFPTNILYRFNENGLCTGFYDFKPKHSNDNLFYDDYKKAVSEYTKKYGEPSDKREIWSNNLMKGDSDRIGLALSAGHVKFITDWETDTTKITLIITGDNYKISFACIYESLVNPNNQSGSISDGI